MKAAKISSWACLAISRLSLVDLRGIGLVGNLHRTWSYCIEPDSGQAFVLVRLPAADADPAEQDSLRIARAVLIPDDQSPLKIQ
jgi:hypothetical protein